MRLSRLMLALSAAGSLVALPACSMNPFGSAPPPPPMVRPAEFTALGLSAAYLSGDVIGGRKTRASRLKAAGIRPLNPYATADYMGRLEAELRRQTAGIGIDVLRVGDSVLVRIPAILTFNSNSSDIRPQVDATLKEVARTVKVFNQSYVDVLGHTDSSGDAKYNLALSQKRAAAVGTYLGGHGVAKARIATRGLGESALLYNPDMTEDQRAANRRIEIRLVPFRQTDLR